MAATDNLQSAIRNPQSFNGVLVIDKPQDWTSHDVVAKVRKLAKTRRVGHTGTLDPFATGVLVVCINRATRLVQFLTGDDKEYLATVRLGFATDSGDLTGKPLSPVADARQITRQQVEQVLPHFRGRIQQIPPMYSAKKIGGVRLHELARRGEKIERQPIEVEIKELELVDWPELFTSQSAPSQFSMNDEAEALTREFSFRVVCSSGTYVRTLAEDIGNRLGIGAHLTELRRTCAGRCNLSEAITLEQLAELSEANRIGQNLISMADAVVLPELRLEDEACKAILHGRSIRQNGNWEAGSHAKLCDGQGQLLAIAEYDTVQLAWRPRVVLAGSD